jgi:hypothetical protein
MFENLGWFTALLNSVSLTKWTCFRYPEVVSAKIFSRRLEIVLDFALFEHSRCFRYRCNILRNVRRSSKSLHQNRGASLIFSSLHWDDLGTNSSWRCQFSENFVDWLFAALVMGCFTRPNNAVYKRLITRFSMFRVAWAVSDRPEYRINWCLFGSQQCIHIALHKAASVQWRFRNRVPLSPSPMLVFEIRSSNQLWVFHLPLTAGYQFVPKL